MKLSPLFIALLASTTASVYANATDIEHIEVKGSYFNDYKVDNANGAMRTSASLLDTAQSVTVITDTIVNEQLATTLGEVLTNDASLTPGSKQRNREVFNLRGFELSSSTGYLRDGHQHWSHYQQPIEILQQVEVIKGPSSILYGQSGPGGLVNMVTKKPTSQTLFKASADVDQHGSTRFMLDAGGALTESEDLRARGILVKQDVDYWREYQNGENRERDRFLGALIVDYDISDNALVRVHYDRTDDEAGLDTGAWIDSNANVIGDDKTIRDMSWAFTDITVENLGVDLEVFLTENWQVKLGYNEQTFERQRFESAPRKPSNFIEGDSYASRPYDRFDDWQFKTAFVDFIGEFETFGIQHQFLIGANSLDYYYGQLKTNAESFDFSAGQNEPFRPAISYKTDDTVSSSAYDYYGIYMQDLISFSPEWQLSLGGRYDKQSKENSNNESFVPKVGVLYHPNASATIYASYSEGFEPQNETLVNTNDVNNGMKLDAITSEQKEIGIKWQLFDDRLMLSGALFDISKTGTLVSEDLVNPVDNITSITTQAGEQRHKGFELAAQGAATDRLFVMASTMYLDANYERDATLQGKRPTDAPKWSASLWTRYELNDVIALNAGAFYEGERFADNANTVTKDAYTRVDVGATYKINLNNTDVNLRLNIENLFDTNYLAGGGLNNVTIGEGASVRLAAQFSF
ncbi:MULTISPECIES: TonB-dependent receptor [Pseudoalteromonas]|uniref:Iron complex outermembrane recepter protein n=2 Tax=Pseudoalteromonas TaxID=53246 RepID=A0AAC9XWC1_9GAMM|nr:MULTISPECIES: TonB-dependent receptor [Pseudoalteromonas]ASM52473.1 iron complex outermembrane recepter protein [Pseudoalteromonas nigrifaciens]MBB1370760.1 TonB-dependent receptor [Pseudoalteromonas sp. SR45-4]MBO7926444.1 TonB-dependent receptor [Pseudoalteromonas sp. K222D]WMS94609.1 TonB-dependent receptor [Pseudoalteromonas sp. HL-AS2]CAI85217.1 putative TonB-dependent receptor; putative outer membrane bound protein involved in iron chelated transport [Pseudoalteromonas translucida]|tara:strand:- start:17344 stop:19419 length:2076 start_codon:yes stop_codon:yes gene_type:complete